MAYNASHRFARIAATKIRPFATMIRGKRAGEAVDMLKYVPNRAPGCSRRY
jgi:large subunit ribosomal protein L22